MQIASTAPEFRSLTMQWAATASVLGKTFIVSFASAFHESRRREAARAIHQHRHLLA
jgi:hypothetical protein